VDAEDLQPAGQPLHVVDELLVPLVLGDLLAAPVGGRVRPRAHERQAAGVGLGAHLLDRARQVGRGLADRSGRRR
jgi:hypothetical protein